MKLKFICPYWGQEHVKTPMFFAEVLAEEFDGIEINLPDNPGFIREFHAVLELVRAAKDDFGFIAQQVLFPANEAPDQYRRRMKARLEFLVAQGPDFINSHTGKDHFSFDDNCRIIEAVENIAARSGIPILHETHRGRFSFHAYSLLPYLEKFPQLKLTGDFSHWCTVSESMLDDQEEVLKKIIPHVQHIHARIGHEQGPQVNNPFAPEWGLHYKKFIQWWCQIIHTQAARGKECVTITPEFGPPPYMPTQPYSKKPLANQWEINAQIKNGIMRKFERSNLKVIA